MEPFEREFAPDIAPAEALVELPACDPEAVAGLRSELGLGELAAQTLVRRGFGDPTAAREFIDGGELRDPALMPGAAGAAAAIGRHLKLGSRIAVHGDYDVDGVTSTAIITAVLSRLGADVTWHVPSRFVEGYGLSRAAIDKLAADGAALIVAVDCGVTAIDEVAYARSLGVDVVICDHHTAGPDLPDAPVAHPGLEGGEHLQQCAATVVWKVAQLVAAEAGAGAEVTADALELAALATVCDVVPLIGENRAIVRAGIDAMRTTRRPGLIELMRAAGVDPLKLDAGAFGFRLGPRINAAGRMFSAEPAVELLLTADERRAVELAEQLGGANARRKDVEQTVLAAAEAQAREQLDGYAIVVAGEGWHPGVLGIVAGRLAERHRRPCVALGVEGGVAAGSGRGGGVYDLIAGLEACDAHLIRYGGHRAAAGLELDEAALPAFARELRAHAAEHLTPDDLRPRVRADAVAGPSQLTLANAEELQRLGPFGAANPEPALLVPAVTVEGLRRMGSGGRHFKLSIAGEDGRAGVVAFGWEGEIPSGEAPPPVNLVVQLRPNEFRGVIEGQAKLLALAVAHQSASDAPGEARPADAPGEARPPDAPGAFWLDSFHDLLEDEPSGIDAGGTYPLHGFSARAIARPQVVAAFRVLRESSDRPLGESLAALAEALPAPAQAALAVRVLSELELLGVEWNGGIVESLNVTEGRRAELELSATFRSYSELKDHTSRWHARSTPTLRPVPT